ncbi:MAG: MurR/RpiR family transcriptional regulator [Sciscionella sp.]
MASTLDNSATVAQRIHASMDELSDAERRVARALLSDYPASGLGTSHELARAAGVSAPTVVRLATRLGFAGFSDMQNRLRVEVSAGASSPVLRTMAKGTSTRHSTGFGLAMHKRIDAIEFTIRLVPAAELAAATALIAGCRAQVLVTGGFFSSAIARILAIQLSQVRAGVAFVEEPLRRDSGQILDAKKRSVVIIFDLRRYEANALTLARQAKANGIDVVLITDRWLSPISAVADVVLAVEVEAVPFDTFVAVLALVEVLVESTLTELGAKGLRRMKQWEEQALGHALVDNPEQR